MLDINREIQELEHGEACRYGGRRKMKVYVKK